MSHVIEVNSNTMSQICNPKQHTIMTSLPLLSLANMTYNFLQEGYWEFDDGSLGTLVSKSLANDRLSGAGYPPWAGSREKEVTGDALVRALAMLLVGDSSMREKVLVAITAARDLAMLSAGESSIATCGKAAPRGVWGPCLKRHKDAPKSRDTPGYSPEIFKYIYDNCKQCSTPQESISTPQSAQLFTNNPTKQRNNNRTQSKESSEKDGNSNEGESHLGRDEGGELETEGGDSSQEANSNSSRCTLCSTIWELQGEEENVSSRVFDQLLVLGFGEEDIYYHQILINNGYLHIPNSNDPNWLSSIFSIQVQSGFVWEDIESSCIGNLIVRDVDEGKIWFCQGEYQYAQHIANDYAELRDWLDDPTLGVFDERLPRISSLP